MHQVQENFKYAGRVGTRVVDAVPILNYLPPSLASWKKTAENFYQIEKTLHMGNIQTERASKAWNWTEELSKSKEVGQMPEVELAYNLGLLADAGLDTTSVQMGMFVVAALSYPKFVPKAQKELDDVVGPHRLPTLDDRENLPYVTAVVEESLRRRNILPSGIPHATLQEDKIMGYRIPKGAL